MIDITRHFSTDMPFPRFARNTLLASLVPLAVLIPAYIASTPEFGPFLLDNPAARGRVIRQILTNGLPVVFLVNYAGFFLFAAQSERRGLGFGYLGFDAVLRTSLFVVLHIVIYAVSADLYGSFGGDRWLAVRVVFPTLARSALFENLSGVYFYALILSALPLYWSAIDQATGRRHSGPGPDAGPDAGAGPGRGPGLIAAIPAPILALLVLGLVTAGFTLLLTAIAALV